MTRDQINTIFTDLGLEAPNKGAVTALLNEFNKEKAVDIFNAKTKAYDDAEAKYKDFVKPEDHQKIVDELEAEKGKGAKAERRSKYEKANLNVDDEDLFNLIDSKLKDSQDFDKDLADYVKAHPSFIKATKDDKDKGGNQEKKKVTIGGTDSEQGVKEIKNDFSMQDAVKDYYADKK